MLLLLGIHAVAIMICYLLFAIAIVIAYCRVHVAICQLLIAPCLLPTACLLLFGVWSLDLPMIIC